jgi:hypothetical protein
MTTTIKSTELDFQTIKTNLKNFLEASDEFNDYDFEGSALNNLLDVLAYNTHYNALTANFALNESFLVTAQLRPSVVSLAESLGYVPDSKKSAEASITFSINLAGVTGLDSQYILEPGELVLRGTRDRIDYTFTNRIALKAVASNGIYDFYPASAPDDPILVYEGEDRSQDFIVGSARDVVYVIPDEEIDISTAIVRVYEDLGSSTIDGGTEFSLYTNLLDASSISAKSKLYVLRESPNSFYELTFGNGTSLGVAPDPGNVVQVNYLRTAGSGANGIPTLKLAREIRLGSYEVNPENVSISVTSKSSGGGDKEGIESIRSNAPFQYAAQNRMVTANDYSTLILKKYSNFISDIQSWGGEDDPNPDYGTVFTSIVWSTGISATTISSTRQGILDLADQFSIASFNLTFVDPVETYIGVQVFFQFNPSLTGLTESSVRSSVDESVDDYFTANTGKFEQVFRLSNMLTDVDATDAAVLSSRANIVLNRRLVPILGTAKEYTVAFPTAIRAPEFSELQTVYSSLFTYNNKTVYIRNKLDQRIRVSAAGVTPVVFETQATNQLEMIDTSGNIVIDNIGSYDKVLGTVTISALNVQSIQGGMNFIKIFAVPANQSVVNSVRNNIIRYDAEESFTKAVLVDTQ